MGGGEEEEGGGGRKSGGGGREKLCGPAAREGGLERERWDRGALGTLAAAFDVGMDRRMRAPLSPPRLLPLQEPPAKKFNQQHVGRARARMDDSARAN